MKKVISIITIIVVLLLLFLPPMVNIMNKQELTLTVTSKEIKAGKNTSTYLVFCEDKSGNVKVLKIKDSLYQWKFNSSDIYAEIKEGQSYIFTVYGFRVPFLSMYQNIDKLEILN